MGWKAYGWHGWVGNVGMSVDVMDVMAFRTGLQIEWAGKLVSGTAG